MKRLLLPLVLLAAACSPQTSSSSAADAAREDPDAPTAAEERAAANAPPPSKLSAAGSRLSARQTDLGAQASSAASGAGSFGGTSSGLHAQVTGLTQNETEKGVELNMSSDVLFDFDQTTLKPEAAAVLQQVAAIINERGNGAAIIITGHTDSKGSDEYNIRLSLARSQAVKDALLQYGVRANMQVHGGGESAPVAPNEHPDGSDNPEGRAQNRRVEVLISSK